MPNRILKESICRSDSFNSLDWFEESLFCRLIVVCDDYGRFDGRAAIIKGACFPLKDVRVNQIEKALCKLSTSGMIERYNTENGSFLRLTAWERHQSIRAKNSKYPSPDEAFVNLKANESICEHMKSDESICSRYSRIENRESINDKKDMCAKNAHDEFFDSIWKLYPVKKGKGQISDTQKKKLYRIGYDEMARAIERYKQYVESVDYLQYQNGSTFFNSGYVDYLDANYAPNKQKSKKNGFNNFKQNEYDYDDLLNKLKIN